MAKNSIFELNGKAYDARSGAFLGAAARIPHTATVQAMPVKTVSHPPGVSIDGMRIPSQAKAHHASHVKAHQPQHTRTLMRHAVKPPHPGKLKSDPSATTGLHSQGALQHKAAHTVVVTPKLSSTTIDPLRAHRARYANRSRSVEHFRPAAQQSPGNIALVQPSLQPAQPVKAQLATVSNPQPQLHHQQSSRHIAATRRPYDRSIQTPTPSQYEEYDEQLEQDLFNQALAQATSHEQPAVDEPTIGAVRRKGSKARRVLAVATSLAVFVALCGLVAFQNRGQIQLQMASAKAGFAASMPLYMPQDYKVGEMSYVNGTVATNFEAKDKQPFVIVQKKSNWDSQTLLDNFVAVSNQDYRGFQSNGRTVYVIGKTSATWVNGGIWYQIKEASGFSDEQLVKIAASM